MREEYRTGLIRGVVAAVFTFGLFILRTGTDGDIATATLFDGAYAGVLAAAPFFGFGAYDARRNGQG